MERYENQCCQCDRCIGSEFCENTNVLVVYCDRCGEEIVDPEEDAYEVEGEDLCLTCLTKMFRKY